MTLLEEYLAKEDAEEAAAIAKEIQQPSPFSARELMNRIFPEPRWAVKGILAEGISILGGRPKSGKSWFAINIALAVASGGMALGKIKAERGDVLYLALEDTPRRLQDRLRKLLAKLGMEIPDGLYFENFWPRADKGGIDALSKWLKEHPDTRLVIIDTVALFRTGNSLRGEQYREDYEAIHQIQELSNKEMIALLGITHTRKEGRVGSEADPLDELQGTTGISGGADSVLVIKRQRYEKSALLFITGRDVEEREIALTIDDEFVVWTIDESETGNPDRGLDTKRKEVRDLIRKAGRALSPLEISRMMKKTPDATRQLCSRMRKEGCLEQESHGRYKIPDESWSHMLLRHYPEGSEDAIQGETEEKVDTPWG